VETLGGRPGEGHWGKERAGGKNMIKIHCMHAKVIMKLNFFKTARKLFKRKGGKGEIRVIQGMNLIKVRYSHYENFTMKLPTLQLMCTHKNVKYVTKRKMSK
jgi:hypothetical protein